MTVVNSMANDTETPEQKIKETLGYKDDPYSKSRDRRESYYGL